MIIRGQQTRDVGEAEIEKEDVGGGNTAES
jgi:hypothetical protein